MFTSVFQYLCLATRYVNVFNVYAFCNLRDTCFVFITVRRLVLTVIQGLILWKIPLTLGDGRWDGVDRKGDEAFKNDWPLVVLTTRISGISIVPPINYVNQTCLHSFIHLVMDSPRSLRESTWRTHDFQKSPAGAGLTDR